MAVLVFRTFLSVAAILLMAESVKGYPSEDVKRSDVAAEERKILLPYPTPPPCLKDGEVPEFGKLYTTNCPDDSTQPDMIGQTNNPKRTLYHQRYINDEDRARNGRLQSNRYDVTKLRDQVKERFVQSRTEAERQERLVPDICKYYYHSM